MKELQAKLEQQQEKEEILKLGLNEQQQLQEQNEQAKSEAHKTLAKVAQMK